MLVATPMCHRLCRIDHPERIAEDHRPFGAFVFTGGAPEPADIDAWSQPNHLAVASHCHPKVSESSSLHRHDTVGKNLVKFGGLVRR
jgi:hypothetical protein